MKPPRRGATERVTNRFESTRLEPDYDHLAPDDTPDDAAALARTTFIPDHSQSILSRNDSPDVPFTYSVNPYRGCEHGCAYCYARPTHEFLGMDAGLDFESKIMVKHDAPKLLRAALSKPGWTGEPIAFSGVTDCYQPAERRFRLTRGCLEVMREFGNAATIVTKNVLVLRDLDILKALAKDKLIKVFISVTTLDPELQSRLEPRTATPAARLDAIARLADAGVPVGSLLAPMIPGLNDKELPALMTAVAKAGAKAAGYVMLRLPLTVRPIFLAWLEKHYPEKAQKIIGRVSDTRSGKMYDTSFGARMEGTGAYADSIAATYKLFERKLKLDGHEPLRTDLFRVPGKWEQQSLFGD